MSIEQQQAMDALYAIDNVLTISISMPPAEWDAVRTEQPRGGRCNFDFNGGARYTWRKATSVQISGTDFPADAVTLRDVGIKKKSFCGSLSSEKPCLHLDFGKFADSDDAEAALGTRYLTLNNSIQDSSYIRQTLGYRILGEAGLPHSRCNYARVLVNGTPIGQGLPGVNSPGIYVSTEPVMKRYIERNFDGNMKGNLYEIEHHDDLIEDRLDFLGVESLSEFDDKADVTFAVGHIAAHGLAGVVQMVDIGQFIKFYAMEFFLKHWDSYSENTNNTYLYNNVVAVEQPGVDDVRFMMIPWGIDQILRSEKPFRLGRAGVVAKLVREDPAMRAQLLDQIRVYRQSLFDRETQQNTWRPLIDQLQALVQGFGVPNAVSRINEVRRQLRLAGSAGYLISGIPTGTPVYLVDEADHCLHASNTESVPAGAPVPVHFEVYHLPLRDDNDKSDLWQVDALGSGRSLTNLAYNRALHASDSVTSAGHKQLYTCPADNTAQADEFTFVKADSPGDFTFSGHAELVSSRTGLAATFGSDLTPGGRPRVHQGDGSRIHLY
jgi:hypothetical protein